MKVVLHKHFKKNYKKFQAIQNKIDERLVLFMKDPFNPILNNHALSGEHAGRRSINITGDYRAIYTLLNPSLAQFIEVDTHSNLYK